MNRGLHHHNPIPETLSHYEREYVETLAGLGVTSTRAPWSAAVEGRDGRLSAVMLAARAARNTLRADAAAAPTVHLWPTWGLLDARLLAYGRSSQAIVLHDPIPIRPQVGHGPRSERWAARSGRHRPLVLVHSASAATDAARRLPHHRVWQVNHPILGHQETRPKAERPTMVVAGQFKPERDIDLMRAVAHWAGGRWALRVHGRGWPEIEGWVVESRFLTETELDAVLGSAQAVLIPYRHYYQSGIAVRALELGTVSFGPSSSFLTELNAGHPELAPVTLDATTLGAALAAAVQPGIATEVHARYLTSTRASWSRAVEVLTGAEER